MEQVMISPRSQSRCCSQDSNLSILLPEITLLIMMQCQSHRSGIPPWGWWSKSVSPAPPIQSVFHMHQHGFLKMHSWSRHWCKTSSDFSLCGSLNPEDVPKDFASTIRLSISVAATCPGLAMALAFPQLAYGIWWAGTTTSSAWPLSPLLLPRKVHTHPSALHPTIFLIPFPDINSLSCLWPVHRTINHN